MKSKNILYLVLVLVLVFVIFYYFNGLLNNDEVGMTEHSHGGGDSPEHIHGIFSVGSYTLYVATHNGLFRFEDESHFDKVGESVDDYMSFLVHPKNSSIMYASGHSNDEHESEEDYANLNVLKSVDGGETWQEISEGVNGPVDFHSMGISSANPEILYGWFSGMQRSLDGGYSWEIVENNLYEVLVFDSHPADENVVYAATVNGLMVSKNKGDTWEFLSEDLKQTPVISLSVNSENPDIMLLNSKKFGLSKSIDAGKTWQKIEENFEGELVTYIVFDKDDPDTVYATTRENTIYKSSNQGEDWTKIYSS